jgi:hypothetical protein
MVRRADQSGKANGAQLRYIAALATKKVAIRELGSTHERRGESGRRSHDVVDSPRLVALAEPDWVFYVRPWDEAVLHVRPKQSYAASTSSRA